MCQINAFPSLQLGQCTAELRRSGQIIIPKVLHWNYEGKLINRKLRENNEGQKIWCVGVYVSCSLHVLYVGMSNRRCMLQLINIGYNQCVSSQWAH